MSDKSIKKETEKTHVATPIAKKCPYGAKNKSECSHIDCIGECE